MSQSPHRIAGCEVLVISRGRSYQSRGGDRSDAVAALRLQTPHSNSMGTDPHCCDGFGLTLSLASAKRLLRLQLRLARRETPHLRSLLFPFLGWLVRFDGARR